jgi:type I restriction-modification system DNA methylase subunit
MKRPKTPQSLKKALMQLRLAVARATVRYALNTTCAQGDIPDAAELSELCDEYALRALAIWLATTCGSHICRSAMSKTHWQETPALLSHMVRTNEYPFCNSIAKELERELEAITRDHLFSGLAPHVELLGTLFEQIANQSLDISLENGGKVGFDIQAKERRRIVGQFYTPPQVVKYCFDIAFGRNLAELINRLKPAKSAAILADHQQLERSYISSTFKVLDPSAGTGNFLCGFIQYVRHTHASASNSRKESAEMLYAIASDSLYARELDARAAALARLAVTISVNDEIGYLCESQESPEKAGSDCVHLYECLGQKLKEHIVVSDSILAAAHLETGADNEFDLVITNPPYVSFGARNQKVLLEGSAKLLKRRYPQAAEYKVRYHSIFQDIALRYAATGGSIVLLVPDGFLTGSYYRKLRKLLLSSCRIQSLSELPASIIPDAVVGRWCIAHYRKEKETAEDYLVDLSTFIDDRGQALEAAGELNAAQTYALSINELRDKTSDSFRLIFDKQDHELLKLTDRMPRLKSVLSGYTGIRSLTGRNSITGRQPLNKSWRRGITSGAQVKRFMVAWAGDWINVNPELLFKGGFNEQVVENPKILVRQTGDSLVCALDPSGLYHLNNVHSFSAALSKDPSLDLLSLCAIMNSSLWRHLYRLRTRETGRALAQVDIDTVEAMPILPSIDHLLCRRVSYLTNRIAELIAYSSLDSCQKTDDLILFIDRSIDRLIYDAYELEPEIVARVENVSGKARIKKKQTGTQITETFMRSVDNSEAARLVHASAKLQSINLETAETRLPSSKEVQDFIEEISC